MTPLVYRIAVRLEENSRGGSRFLHQQRETGQSINDFNA